MASRAPIVPESDWAAWRADRDEFRKVRVTGTFLHEFEAPVYGLAPGERQGAPIQGYYLLTPLEARERRRRDGQPRLRADRPARSGPPPREPACRAR